MSTFHTSDVEIKKNHWFSNILVVKKSVKEVNFHSPLNMKNIQTIEACFKMEIK